MFFRKKNGRKKNMLLEDANMYPATTVLDEKRDKFDFTYRWFDHHSPTWPVLLADLKNHPIRVLEIGVLEGNSTTWILEELCQHPDARLVAIDTFCGCPKTKDSAVMKPILETMEERFHSNIKKTGFGHKVRAIKSKSFEAVCGLHTEGTDLFDLVFVDGSHSTVDVLADGVLSWPLLRIGGWMIFDDYDNPYEGIPNHSPKKAIDAFLDCYEAQLEIHRRCGQVAIRKTEERLD